jgi:uncharacterized protein YvpB
MRRAGIHVRSSSGRHPHSAAESPLDTQPWPPLWSIRHSTGTAGLPSRGESGKQENKPPRSSADRPRIPCSVETILLIAVLAGILGISAGSIWLIGIPFIQNMSGHQTISEPRNAPSPAGSMIVPLQSNPTSAGDQFATPTAIPPAISLRMATPIREERLPAQVLLSDFQGHRQERPLNCEFRSASDLAGYYGYDIHWEKLFLAVGHDPNGNPNRGFVGKSLDDPAGRIYPDGYGVYAEPVARGLQQLGVPGVAHQHCSTTWLRQQLAGGNPVVVWVTMNMRASQVVQWTAADGSVVTGVVGEHTMTAIGYDPETIWVFDPAEGRRKQFPWDQFEQSWSYLERMALTIGGEHCY